MADMSYLVKQIKSAPSGLRLRQGYVYHYDSTNKVLDIQLAGDSNILPGVKYLHSYAPQTGDTVWLLTSGSDILCIGNQQT